MKLLIIAAVLQATAPAPDAPQTTSAAAAQGAPSVGDMECVYDRQLRARLCTAANGEQYRCRRERVMGSRMPVTLCTTAAQDAQLERDSRQTLDQQQRITTPSLN